MKLLIVDDHAGVRGMIRQLTAAPGDIVMECASGEEAVRIARDFAPDWVTMDVRMPGMDGLETTRAVQACSPNAQVMIVSGHYQPELQSAARAAGAIAYLSKEDLGQLKRLMAERRRAKTDTSPLR